MTVPILSPEELLSFVKKSYDVPAHAEIDMIPLFNLIFLVANWDGERGQEPQWMREADIFLNENVYTDKDYRDTIVSEEEFSSMSISERASMYDLLNFINDAEAVKPPEVPADSEEDLAGKIIYPTYTPSPASVFDSDYAPDGSSRSRASCNGCGQKSEFMTVGDTFRWVDAHNESCKFLPQ